VYTLGEKEGEAGAFIVIVPPNARSIITYCPFILGEPLKLNLSITTSKDEVTVEVPNVDAGKDAYNVLKSVSRVVSNVFID